MTDLGATFYFAPGQYHLWIDTPVTPVPADEPLPLGMVCGDPAALNFGADGVCSYEVVIALDATDLAGLGQISPNGLHVAGSFQGWDPGGTPLEDAGDDLWVTTVVADEGSLVEFKFINGTTWDDAEVVPLGCGGEDGYGGYNRQILVEGANSGGGAVCFAACAACSSNLDFPGCTDADASNYDPDATVDDGSCTYSVVFQVDASLLDPVPSSVHVVGSFQGWNVAGTPMSEMGDGLWAVQLDLLGGTAIEYKFLSGPDWALEESVPEDCGTPNGFGGFNRSFTPSAAVNTLPVVCFSGCDACDTTVVDPPADGADFCGPGTVWDPSLSLCVGVATCSEDVDGDGLVGVSDVLALLSAFGGLCE